MIRWEIAMSNQSDTSQIQQEAIWYYSVDGTSKGPLTSAAIVQLYETGLLKDNTLLWKQGFPDWKPIWQFIKGDLTFNSVTRNPVGSRTSSKKAIPVIIVTLMLIFFAFGYLRFFAKTPLEGGWQVKNTLDTAIDVMLFDNGNCWIYGSDGEPRSVNYLAIKDGDSSYKVTFFKNNRFIVFSISFVNDNTIQISASDLSDVVTMTRINKTTAKSMMGIE